ncbi:MAG: response regulator, partial [Bacteroidales bacterium]|nr:response regulator [Bacteroidales bacterium]
LLLAEDDDPSFLLLKAMLRKTGIEIIRAKNGIEAVSLSRSESDISLILMDINMPEMNGYEATKIIKAEKPYIPVIAQTAYSISGDKERTIESGCDDYISKPIKKQELFRLIQKYI